MVGDELTNSSLYFFDYLYHDEFPCLTKDFQASRIKELEIYSLILNTFF
jgi:hypothetical protein